MVLSKTLILLVFIVVSNVLTSQVFGQIDGNISMEISYLKDTTNTLKLENLTTTARASLKGLDDNRISLGRDKSVYWFRVDLNLINQEKEDYLFDIDYSLVDHIDYYYQKDLGVWNKISTGSQRAYNDRYLDYRNFAFPINSELQNQTIFIRIESENVLNFNFLVRPTKAFFVNLLYEEIYHGIFIGFLLLVLLVNIILYVVTVHKSFIIYVWYMFFTLCVNLFLSGHIGQYLFRDYGNWQNQLFNFSFACAMVFSIWFAYEFLNLRKGEKRARLFLSFVVFVAIIIGCVSPFADYNTLNSLLSSLTLTTLLLVIYIGIKQWRKGNIPSFFYTIAYISYLIFIAPVILSSFNVMDRGFMSIYGTEFGAFFEAFLLAVALSYRYNEDKRKLHKEKKIVLEENLKLQKELHSKLELKVQQRTHELNEAMTQLKQKNEEIEGQKENIEKQNKQLEKMNDDKSRFISILAHDVKGPINSLFSFAELLKNHIDYLTRKELVDLGKKLGTHTKNLFSLLENLLQWSRAQSGRMDIKPACFNINDAILQNIALTEMLVSNKRIDLIYSEKDYMVYADKNMIDTVLRNLIANAIKFSFERSEILINTEKINNELVIKIIDKGVGMSPQIQKKLFDISTKHSTSGTAGEKGTGLGLKLCKEFVDLNNGRIWVESKYGKGSTFIFTVPLDTIETTELKVETIN